MMSLAQRLLLRKIDRTAITIMMLVPIIALLVGSNLLITGYAHEAQNTIGVTEPSNEYMIYNSSNIFPNSMSYNTYLQINTSEVKQAIPYLQVSGDVSMDNRNHSTDITATNIESFVLTRHPAISGNLPSNKSEIAVGTILSELLGVKTGDKIGVTIFSQTHNFSITCVLNSTSKYDAMLLLPLSTMWNDWPITAQSVSYVEFQANKIPSGIPAGLTITSEATLGQVVTSFTAETTNLIQIWVYLLLGLSAVVAVGASFRTTSGTVLEYQILRTIGARISEARKLIVYEHLAVSGVSTIMGVTAGIAVTQVMSTFLSSTFGLPIVPVIDLIQIILLGVASFTLIFLIGLVSIYRISRSIRIGF